MISKHAVFFPEICIRTLHEIEHTYWGLGFLEFDLNFAFLELVLN